MHFAKQYHESSQTGWRQDFVTMLPEIEQRLRGAFRDLNPEARDDATAEGIVNCLLAFVRLFEQGRMDAASASTLAWFGVLQVRKGRQAGCRLNSRELLSRYAQRHNGFEVERLDRCIGDEWVDVLVEDKRSSVANQVAARMDIRAWLATLTVRTRRIARDLAKGFSTSETARKHGISAGRISQMRRVLEESWQAFQGESLPGASRGR
jgi:hypothetical protein